MDPPDLGLMLEIHSIPPSRRKESCQGLCSQVHLGQEAQPLEVPPGESREAVCIRWEESGRRQKWGVREIRDTQKDKQRFKRQSPRGDTERWEGRDRTW